MKINLAENMLRFGVKNLKESDKQKIQSLTEQKSPLSNAQRNSQAITKQSNAIENAKIIFATGAQAVKNGFCIYSKVVGPGEPENLELKINSIFYNNMVSAKGLMPRFTSDMDASIRVMLDTIRQQKFSDVTITIKGTATSADPGPDPDPRYTGKLKLADDHNGPIYGGIDYNTDPQKANLWLAQQRAKTLANRVSELAKEFRINAKIETTGEVVTGTVKDDVKRYSKAMISGTKPTYKNIPIGNPTLNFEVKYEEKQLGSNDSYIQNKSGGSKISDIETVWRGTVEITFGADAIPITGYSQQIPAMTGRYAYKNNPGKHKTNEFAGNWSTKVGSLSQDNLVGAKDTIDGIGVSSANLFGFLRSCGRFTNKQANEIISDIKLVNGKLMNAVRNSESGVISGNLDKFSEIYGGSSQLDMSLASGGYILNQTTMTLDKIA